MAYEADDGPVSDETLTALKARVPQDRYKTVVSTLFPNEGQRVAAQSEPTV